jgi:enamine deaminase RidA (YjgF/YER057c/UK114 family)
VRVRRTVHVSGTTGTDEGGKITHVGDMYRQTKKALDEYRKVLQLNPEVEALRVKVQQLEEQLLQEERLLQKERKRR